MGSDSAAAEAAEGTFPRSLTSKGWVSPARPVSPEFPPRPLCPDAARLRSGKTCVQIVLRPFHRKTLGAAPTQRISRKPPLQARCGKAPGSASRPPALLPGGESKTRLEKASPELAGEIGETPPFYLGVGNWQPKSEP